MSSAPSAPLELPLPRNIGRYTLFDRVGRGGMADIYLARTTTDLGASRLVVVKQILASLAAIPEFSDLLITEAKLAARLNHANVVQVHDLGRENGFLYIAMQYVEGFDLNDLLKRCAQNHIPLPVEYALLIVTETLRGLDYAHRRSGEDGMPLGIVHRDVSPSNVLISLDGEIKLCDFGIAHANDVSSVLPEDVVRGKAGYMSPEQARGDPLDARADVFALGIIFWELLAGRRLYKAVEGGPALLELAREAAIPELPPRNLPFESELFGMVQRALGKDRDRRPTSAQALLREVEAYVAKAKLMASPLRFGEWLMKHFGEDLVDLRRARERAAKALDAGPLTYVEAIGGSAMSKTPPPPRMERTNAALAASEIASSGHAATNGPSPNPSTAPLRSSSPSARPIPIFRVAESAPPSAVRKALPWALAMIALFLLVYAWLRLS